MALQLTRNYKGIEANYWRINTLNYDDVLDRATVSLWLYKDEAAKNESLENTLIREVIVLDNVKDVPLPEDMSGFTNSRDLLKAMLYNKIKQPILDEEGENINPWVDAVDC